MLKRLGITVAIPIGIFGYAYLCKYLFSLMEPQSPSFEQWILGFILLGILIIPPSLCLIGIIIYLIMYLIHWIITGDPSSYYEDVIPLFRKKVSVVGTNEDKDYTKALKEVDELFPGKSNEMEML